MKTMNILGSRSYTILYRTETSSISKYRVMLPITEKQEEELDKKKMLTLNSDFTINGDKVLTYGEHEVDKKEGRNYLRSINICSLDSENFVYTNIDYKTGQVYSDENGKFLQSPTWDNIVWFMYNLCLLGNPQRIVIFDVNKEELKNLYNEFNE